MSDETLDRLKKIESQQESILDSLNTVAASLVRSAEIKLRLLTAIQKLATDRSDGDDWWKNT